MATANFHGKGHNSANLARSTNTAACNEVILYRVFKNDVTIPNGGGRVKLATKQVIFSTP
jgi:hypothetical protein